VSSPHPSLSSPPDPFRRPANVGGDASGPPRGDWRRGLRWTLGILLSFMLGSWLVVDFPDEVARWHMAAGENAALDGDLDAAVHHAGNALAWARHRSPILLARSRWKLAGNDLEGSLADCDAALEATPRDPLILSQRSEVLQRLGRHDEALADYDLAAELMLHSLADDSFMRADPFDQARAMLLNNRAYFRARAGQDLEGALQMADLALRYLHGNGSYAVLDTRGYLHYLLGNHDAALADMERAVAHGQLTYVHEMARLEREMQLRLDRRRQLQQKKALEQSMAVVYYHRALVYDAQGKKDLARRDYQRADALGYGPENGAW
jgi:tetratricopeptide (TPR) repeat protein